MTQNNRLKSKKSAPLSGTARIPGDKSISHRSLMLGTIAREETMISGLLEGEDILCTAMAARALGANIQDGEDGIWRIFGTGEKGLESPDKSLDMGNSGTSTRLLMGLLAGYPVQARLDGDVSLVKRPMKRVIEPLTAMGAQFQSEEGGRLPLTIEGTDKLKAIEYRLPVASAQVKSAILLAGLHAEGTTTVIEDRPTRDHTENMLRHFGAEITIETLSDGASAISIKGGQPLYGCAVDIYSDPSSAAFPAVAAALIEDSEIKLLHIGINERRAGIYTILQQMGADITFTNRQVEMGEPVADIIIRGTGPLKAIDIPPEYVPGMIDEFPVLAVAAACANGTTRMTGLAELRVKESDRLAMIAKGLAACGVKLEEGKDSLTIYGTGKPPKGGAIIETALDHRIAMSFLVLGCVTDEPVEIDDSAPIKTSFPNFVELMNELGTNIEGIEN